MKLLNTLLEGGNVFKDKQGQPLTQRINQADVPATIAYLENILGMEFPEERWLGSTGRKPTSGDLDLAVPAPCNRLLPVKVLIHVNGSKKLEKCISVLPLPEIPTKAMCKQTLCFFLIWTGVHSSMVAQKDPTTKA
jgi:hypothetical protein